MKCAVELALARQPERVAGEEKLPHLGRSIEDLTCSINSGQNDKLTSPLRTDSGAFSFQVDAVEEHATAVDLERRVSCPCGTGTYP